MFIETVSYPAALLAGFLSFLSPCVLPLIPAYFTFISGYSIDELTQNPNAGVRTEVLLSTILFVSGFSLVFILMGASASFLGGLITANRDFIRIIGGILVIVLGIHMLGFIRFKMLEIEKRMHVQKKPLHLIGIFVIGMAFGAGWSPCIGPLLGSILIIAGSNETVWQGVLLLSVYAAGLALPFLLISIFIPFLLKIMHRTRSTLKYINMVAGALLIAIGIFLLTDSLVIFNQL